MSEQHLSEIEIPDIEIAADWPVSDIETIEDCDDAYSYLMAAVAEIERELELKDLGICRFADPTWPARARCALKYKRAALQLVQWKRSRIEKAKRAANQAAHDRKLLDHIKANVPHGTFMEWVARSGAADALESEAA